MPAFISLPAIDIGDLVSGDLILRNVVINTGSSRISKPVTTQPAMPLDGTRPSTPRPIIDFPKTPPRAQYSPDLVIPTDLPANAYGVLIDNVNKMVVKANPQETAQFIQEGMYFIGSFDSDTADAVIEDMLANPIPTETQLINQAFDEGFPLAVSSYLMGMIIFEAVKNAQENWGNFIPLEERLQDAFNTPPALPFPKTSSAFPKTPLIYFSEASEVTLTSSGRPLQMRSAKSFIDEQLKARNLPYQIAKDIQGELGLGVELSGQVNNQDAESRLYDMVTALNDKGSIGYFLDFIRPTPAQPAVTDLSQYSSVKQIQDAYTGISLEIHDLEQSGKGYIFEDVRPLTDEELRQEGVTNQIVTNPNFNLPPREPLVIGYETFTYKDGTSITKQIPIKQDAQMIDAQKEGYRQWYAQWARVADKLNEMAMTKTSVDGSTREGMITEEHRQQAKAYQEYNNYFLLRDISLGSIVSPTKGYPSARWLKPEDVETYAQYRARIGLINKPEVNVLPSTEKVVATPRVSPKLKELQEQQSIIAQQLGVPANCKPTSPLVVPPALVPSNCLPPPPINPPIVPNKPQVIVPPIINPPSTISNNNNNPNPNPNNPNPNNPNLNKPDPNIPKGGGFIILPRANAQGGQAVHYPSGRQFTIVSDGQGGNKIGSYIAGTGLT